MDLAKFVLAVSISLILTLFFTDVITLIYKAPKLDYDKCNDIVYSTSACSNLITQQCGTYSYGMDYNAYYDCKDEAMDSAEYTKCIDDAGKERKNCMENEANKLVNYGIISFWIYAILGTIFILTGLLIIQFRGIGSGLILGGVSLILFSGIISLFVQLSSIMSSVSSLMGGDEGNTGVNWVQVSRILVSFIILIILIVIGYFKVDRKEDLE